MKIAIIDYDVGNMRSVEKGFAYVGVPAKVTKDPSEIDVADALVLPGVGAFESGMRRIAPLRDVVLDRVREGVPLLGICLGMQMLYEESEEGGVHKGLGLAKGRITRFSNGLKVPHMGWNSLSIKNESHPLLKGIKNDSYVYFVHSYKASVSGETLASSDYGGEFTAIVAGEPTILGTQFHPEKSGDVGLRMLKNFADMAK